MGQPYSGEQCQAVFAFVKDISWLGGLGVCEVGGWVMHPLPHTVFQLILKVIKQRRLCIGFLVP
jgi:hypothetical protein